MRRVVTGHDPAGRSTVVSDGTAPRTHHFAGWPGFISSVAWFTDPTIPVSRTGQEPSTGESVLPPPGGTCLIWLTLPPDATAAAPEFDRATYEDEQRRYSPGLAETLESDGMHTTPTIDYIIVVEGEVWLLLDEEETRLQAGDVVVQNATRHGWSNRSDASAVLACVLVGTELGY